METSECKSNICSLTKEKIPTVHVFIFAFPSSTYINTFLE